MKEILQEEEDLSEIVQQLFLRLLFFSWVSYRWGDPAGGGASLRLCINCFWGCCSLAEFPVIYLSFLQVKEILQEEEDLSEIAQQLFLRLLFFSWVFYSEGDPAVGGECLWDWLFVPLLRLCSNCFWGYCSSAEFCYSWRRSCRRRRTCLRLCSNCFWGCCSSADFLTGKGDPAGGGEPVWDCAATVFEVAVLQLRFFTGEGDPAGGGGPVWDCAATVFEVAVLQSCLLQVKEIMLEEENLYEIVCFNCFWGCCSLAEFLTGERDSAGGGGPLWDCAATVAVVPLRLNCFWGCCSLLLFFYRWRRSCRRKRTSLRLCVSTVVKVAVLQLSFLQVKEILHEEEDLSEIVCFNCFWGCCSLA